MIALYDFTLSGNCYKVRLMLHLGLEYKAIPVNLKERAEGSGISRHPFGKVPVLVDNNTCNLGSPSGLFCSSVWR